MTSHDRRFLYRIATHILAFEADAHVEFFPGNFHEYEANQRTCLGEEVAKPHWVKYSNMV